MTCIPGPTKSCVDNDGCTLDSCEKNTGECRHVALCPRPAIDNLVTLAGRWTVSGYVDVFATPSSIVVQWTASRGWTASTLSVYLNRTRPDILPEPNKFPYWHGSAVNLKFIEVVIPLSEFPEADCDTSFFVSVHLNTIGDVSAICGVDYDRGKEHNCHGAQPSWMLGNFKTSQSKAKWGYLYHHTIFCCCFDSSSQFLEAAYKKVSFRKTPKISTPEAARSFLVELLGRLLAVPHNTISVREAVDSTTVEPDTYVMWVKFISGPVTSATTALSILESLEPEHFEHLGGKDFVLHDLTRDASINALFKTSSASQLFFVLGVYAFTILCFLCIT